MGLISDFIDGFIEGVSSHSNQEIIDSSQPNVQKGGYTTISSLQEMSRWLQTLQRGASPAVREALSAQVNVIRFVQSPTLIDTTFDTLLYSLDKSLRVAKTPKEKADMREVFCLMIQNYVFFLDAKYQMEVNKSREEGRQLFIEAGEMLSNTIKDIALMAIGDAGASEIANTTINNLFAPENESGGISNFLNRLFNYINQEDILFEQQKQFYVTIENFIIKLGEPDTQQLLGKSNLLAGTIKRYLPGLRDFCFEHNSTINTSKALDDKNFNEGLITSLVWFFGSLFWAFLRWGFYYPLAGPAPEGWFGRQMLWTVGILAGIIFLFYLGGYQYKKNIKKETSSLNEHFDSLYAIAETYKEPFDSQNSQTTIEDDMFERLSKIVDEEGPEAAFRFAQAHLHDEGCEFLYISICNYYTVYGNSYSQFSKGIEVADEGINVAKKIGDEDLLLELNYIKAFLLESIGEYEQARKCYSFVESHVNPEITDKNGQNIKELCQTKIKEISNYRKPTVFSREEQEYADLYKDYTFNGGISEKDRRLLNNYRTRLGITESRANEIEMVISGPNLTNDELEYLGEIKAIHADGAITIREQKYLDKVRTRLGINEERAKEIELML